MLARGEKRAGKGAKTMSIQPEQVNSFCRGQENRGYHKAHALAAALTLALACGLCTIEPQTIRAEHGSLRNGIESVEQLCAAPCELEWLVRWRPLSDPNNTQPDNYGTRGNVNPYPGAIGTLKPGHSSSNSSSTIFSWQAKWRGFSASPMPSLRRRASRRSYALAYRFRPRRGPVQFLHRPSNIKVRGRLDSLRRILDVCWTAREGKSASL